MGQIVKTTWTSSVVSQVSPWKILRKSIDQQYFLLVFWIWQKGRKLQKMDFHFKMLRSYVSILNYVLVSSESQCQQVIKPLRWLLKMHVMSCILVEVCFCLGNLRTKSLLKWKSMTWACIFAWNNSKLYNLIFTGHQREMNEWVAELVVCLCVKGEIKSSRYWCLAFQIC